MFYTTLLKTILRARRAAPPERPDDDRAGLVLVADGVGGLELCGTALQFEVARAGLPLEVRLVSWGHGLGRWHADLTRTANHARRAAALAAEVAAFRGRRPAAPAFLVGKSGGAGIVVGALERLPAGAVEAAILLAPALSPGYDLSMALGAVRRELVVFYSPFDVIILGLGTRIFGTIDRVRSAGAGLVGFRVPDGLDESGRAPYAKVRQIRWRPAMATTGYLGGHVGPDMPAFLRKYVVPLLKVAPQIAGPAAAGSSPSRVAPIT